jgi:hypothetical protein
MCLWVLGKQIASWVARELAIYLKYLEATERKCSYFAMLPSTV